MKTHDKYLKYLIQDQNNDFLLKWNSDTPHFGGKYPHRYDTKMSEIEPRIKSNELCCHYCGKPKTYKGAKS